jgi:phosphoribosylglycinamide formyltransferase-1
MIPIVVLASGRGSNFEAIYDAIQRKKLRAKILAVVSDQPNAKVLEKAKSIGIPVKVVPVPQKSADETAEDRRRKHEIRLLETLQEVKPRFLVMAGYMRIVTPLLIEAFRSENGYTRMVNVHPSILPAFPGVHSYSQAFHYGAKVAGVTVHLVETDVDSGPICAQESFSIADCRSEFEVEQRGLEVEHRLYPETLDWVLTEEFSVVHRSQGRLCVCPN